MLRRLLVLLTVLALAGVGMLPSQAAAKKKPPNIEKSYDLTLNPDPTGEVVGNVKDGCAGLIAGSQNKHPFTVPAAGKLVVHLLSPDPTGKQLLLDWDFYLLGADGTLIDSANGLGGDEATTTTFRKKTPLSIWACNMTGNPAAHVTISFKYA